MGQHDDGGNGKGDPWADLAVARDRCDECDPGRLVQAHNMRIMGLEQREGAAVAATRATRDDMRELRIQFGEYFKQLIDNQVRQGERLKSIEARLEAMKA